jgi:hypothetical protein
MPDDYDPIWVNPVTVGGDANGKVRFDDLEELAAEISEDDRKRQQEWLDAVTKRVKLTRATVREEAARKALTGTDGTDFQGFCDACGGFRRHKLGCKPPPAPSGWPANFFGGP